MPEETAVERELVFQNIEFPMKKERVRSEREILELVKKGNREAYQEIVCRYMKSAYYIALGLIHNHQDALDLSQEAFVRAFRRIKSFDAGKPFFPWFYQLMKNLCIDHLKRTSRMKEVPLEGIQVLDEEKEDKEMKKALWKGIEELTFEQREVIILRYFRQFSYREISEIICKPIGTVMSSLYYAKKRLKVIVAKYLGFE
jgi:RNA polymerase sigma-70 factor (ECF subfamily)